MPRCIIIYVEIRFVRLLHSRVSASSRHRYFEIRDAWGPDAKERGVQVRNSKHAAALAKKIGDAPVVILRGHAHNVVADSVRRAVVRAAYVNINARVQMDAMRLSSQITLFDQKEIAYNVIENFDVERPCRTLPAS